MIGNDLTKGPIFKKLLQLSVPLIVAQFLGIAYNLTDIFWLGKVSATAVSAVGAIGLFLWLSFCFNLLVKIGCEVRISQAFGAKKLGDVNKIAVNSFLLMVMIAFAYSLFLFFGKDFIVGFFRFNTQELIDMTYQYLSIAVFVSFFLSIAEAFKSIYNGIGNTKLMLIFSSVGLVTNMILDPLFILKLDMGVKGAGYATLIAAIIPVLLFTFHSRFKTHLLKTFRKNIDKAKMLNLLNLGYVPALQNMLFCTVSIVISRYVVQYGDNIIAVSRIGSQLESLTWMIAGSLATAVSVFTGQNIAVKQYHRIQRGYTIVLGLTVTYSIAVTLAFIFYGQELFLLFIPNDIATSLLGANYLFILAFSQTAAIVEGVTNGFFNGQGKTKVPAYISVIGNLARLGLVFYFADLYGVNGVWLGITLSSVLKGVLNLIALVISVMKNKEFKFRYFISKKEDEYVKC